MQRYFLNQVDHDEQSFELPSDIAHHLVTVLRAQIGDQAEFVLNQRKVMLGRLTKIEGKHAWVTLEQELVSTSELPVNVVLACGVPKGEKAQLIVQKATELGAQQIVFFDAERSVSHWRDDRQSKKIAKLAKVAQGAAEQSHRTVIPTVSYHKQLSKVIEVIDPQTAVVAWEESAKQGEQSHLAQVLHQLHFGETLLAVIGPEGGLTTGEVAQLETRQVVPVGLGPRILRTETAPLYLLAAVSYYFELEN